MLQLCLHLKSWFGQISNRKILNKDQINICCLFSCLLNCPQCRVDFACCVCMQCESFLLCRIGSKVLQFTLSFQCKRLKNQLFIGGVDFNVNRKQDGDLMTWHTNYTHSILCMFIINNCLSVLLGWNELNNQLINHVALLLAP